MASPPIILTDADHLRISQAVHAAESRSAGEIVTIITDRSDGYTDIALAWAAFAALTALTVLSVFPDVWLPVIDRILGRWGHEWTHRELLMLAAIVATTKFVAAMALQLWPPLKWALVPRHITAARVQARAVTCFKVGAERRTTGRTGILIYVSRAERHAEILADVAIASKVRSEVWGDAMAALLRGLRAGKAADGMIGAVEQVGAILEQHFPRADDDQNELPDRLIEV